MDVHAAAVVADQRLGHEGDRLAVALGYVLDHVLEHLDFFSLLDQGVEQHADFALAGSGDFVVVHLDANAHFFQGQAHGGADVVQGVNRRYREVAALDARTVTEVATLVGALGVPAGLGGVDLIEAAADVGTPADVVKNEEFVFRAEVGGIGDAGGLQVGFGATRD